MDNLNKLLDRVTIAGKLIMEANELHAAIEDEVEVRVERQSDVRYLLTIIRGLDLDFKPSWHDANISTEIANIKTKVRAGM